MIKIATIVALVTLSALSPVAAQAQDVSISAGKSLFDNAGKRIGAIYRVTDSGVVQLIINGKAVSIAPDSVSVVDGKIVSALTKKQLTSRK